MNDAEKKIIVDAVKQAEASIKARVTDPTELAEALYEIGDLLEDIYPNVEADGMDYPLNIGA